MQNINEVTAGEEVIEEELEGILGTKKTYSGREIVKKMLAMNRKARQAFVRTFPKAKRKEIMALYHKEKISNK